MTDTRCIMCKYWQGNIDSVEAICDNPEFVILKMKSKDDISFEKPIHKTHRDSTCGNHSFEIPKEFLSAFRDVVKEVILSAN